MTDLSTAARPGDDPYAARPVEDPFAPPAGALAERPTWTPGPPGPPPLYWRVLRLHYVRPNGWQRALLVEGVIAVAATLVLADVASAWTLVVLPVAVAAVVKAHDLLVAQLGRARPAPLPPVKLTDYAPAAVSLFFIVVVRVAVRSSSGKLTFEAVLLAMNALLCLAIYRYLVRRNTTRETATLIAATGFFLSVFAAALGAALEVRRHRAEAEKGSR